MSSNPHKEHTPEWYAFEAGRAAILDLEVIRLKAELAILRAASFTTAVPSEDYDKLVQENFDIAFDLREMERANARLKAEVERLRKAGDEVAQRYLTAYQIDLRNGPHTPQSIVEWNAAKEGKQP